MNEGESQAGRCVSLCDTAGNMPEEAASHQVGSITGEEGTLLASSIPAPAGSCHVLIMHLSFLPSLHLFPLKLYENSHSYKLTFYISVSTVGFRNFWNHITVVTKASDSP